ncbi:MAG: formylglycine-generating enzyme family protein, partial [Methylococcales bacterium]
WGLHDMAGNVWEWTCSAYAENYDHSESERVCASDNDAKTPRVVRGGSWDDDPGRVRSANRFWNTPGDRYFSLGFRLSRM